jgi:hypothetical protein
MLLLKRTSAWDELSQLVDRDEELGRSDTELIKLHNLIEGSGEEDALDNVVSEEYPAGVEVEELEDFFKDEQDFILEQLGIDGADEELDDDEDEDLED